MDKFYILARNRCCDSGTFVLCWLDDDQYKWDLCVPNSVVDPVYYFTYDGARLAIALFRYLHPAYNFFDFSVG